MFDAGVCGVEGAPLRGVCGVEDAEAEANARKDKVGEPGCHPRREPTIFAQG